jgi:hypothetical protein
MIRSLLALLVATAIFTAAAPASAQNATPTSVVDGFYHWYFTDTGSNHEWFKHLSGAQRYLDPTLYANLAAALDREQKTHSEIIDFDPWVNAQWDAQAYAVGTVSAHGKAFWIPVTLTLSGRPNSTTHLTMIVGKNSSGEYRIDNVVYTVDKTTFDLSSFLTKALKSS